jgi:cell division septum initiation protein DivIVA
MDINAILEENEKLKQRISELEEKLNNYTNPPAHKVFYEKIKKKLLRVRF